MLLMTDYNQSLSVAEAVRRAHLLDEAGVCWIEEPVSADDFAGHAQVAREARTPVQQGICLGLIRGHTSLPKLERYLGVPYLWGGCTPLGIDCSGFVQLVWRLNGASLPRDAHQQAECGQEVAPGEATAGDLLFFGGESGAGITHVAICLEGGRMIHAAGESGMPVASH